jgi:isocitrate/isopropylmalate dehydrogenase
MHNAVVTNRILVIKGQGIGPECIEATKKVIAATGVPIEYLDGQLGYPDIADVMHLLHAGAPELYRQHFGNEAPDAAGVRLEASAKSTEAAKKDRNKFYNEFLNALPADVKAKVRELVAAQERETLTKARQCHAVLKGALRTLDEGEEPSRNVTIRKGFEQYANIRRCVTLDPIAPGAPGADILFVRENVEDLYASIEHLLSRSYTQALRHLTPEGCELICRAAFEAGVRDGRKKVTALEKPNILKKSGGLFKDVFNRVAKDYPQMESAFMIIDDGLAAIAAKPADFDVVVTTNMFGDIGSDIAAKVTGGVGLVSSNNTNPMNPAAVSMFETMGGTADDIAGQNKANPVALIDAGAEMLLHIGGRANIEAAEMIKAAILMTLADGHTVGDIREGEYQKRVGGQRLGAQEFAGVIAEKVALLKDARAKTPGASIKQLALDTQTDEAARTLFARVLRSYEAFASAQEAGSAAWAEAFARTLPPNPVRAQARITGFDMFVDECGLELAFTADGTIDATRVRVPEEVRLAFQSATGLDVAAMFDAAAFGSLQAIRSFGEYAARKLAELAAALPDAETQQPFGRVIEARFGAPLAARFAKALREQSFTEALAQLEQFRTQGIRLIQSFYLSRHRAVEGVLAKHGFRLARITSRGTEIFPTMLDFEKRAVDRFRVELDPTGPLSGKEYECARVQQAIAKVLGEMTAKGWTISEMMLNRVFIDAEGPKAGTQTNGVSLPYAMGLGDRYADAEWAQAAFGEETVRKSA